MKQDFNESALLALFYDSDHFREQIKAPFLSDGYVCATETHRLIMIKPEICNGDYKPNNLHVLKVLNPHDIDITLTLAKLKKAVGRVASEKEMKTIRPAIKCKDCDGDGEVEWSYEDKDGYTHEEYHTCPICNGSGNSSPAREEPTGRMINTYRCNRHIRKHIQRISGTHALRCNGDAWYRQMQVCRKQQC